MKTRDGQSVPHERGAARQVAIVIDASSSFSRGVLAGVSSWMHDRGDWTITIDDRDRVAPLPAWLLGWHGDGLISGLDDAALPRLWRRSVRPVVHVRRCVANDVLPGVFPDDEAAVRLAVTHLVDRGLRRLAFCPAPLRAVERPWDAGARHAQSLGCEVDIFVPPACRSADGNDREAVLAWLAGLTRPVGVIAADVRAVQILEACRVRGLSVPDDVAVVAIGDDDVLCQLATPALTSVTIDRMRIGHEAARLLDDTMQRGLPVSATTLVPPLGIAVRASSDLLAVADLDVRKALRLIQARACADLSAAEVAASVGVSRRPLDRKFLRLLGRSIHDEMQRTKLAEAKRLLAETEHKLMFVAARSGFVHAAQLCNVFKAAVGMSPMEYRRAERHCRKIAGGTVEPGSRRNAAVRGVVRRQAGRM
jgi:LacI family transcriptional regulator